MTSPVASKQLRELTPKITPKLSRPYLSSGARGLFPHHSPHYVSPMPHRTLSPHRFSATNSPHILNQSKSQKSQQSDVIYGTTISLRSIYQTLQKFIRQFQIPVPSNSHRIQTQQQNEQEVDMQKIYLTQLSQFDFEIQESNIFNIKGIHLKQFDLSLYLQFIYFPAQMIMVFDQIIRDLYQKIYINQQQLQPERLLQKQRKRDNLMVGITHLSDIKIMRNIDQKQINRLISFRGIVVRTSDIVPEMKRAYFKCTRCFDQLVVALENAKVQEPKQCPKCYSKASHQLIHNLCQFTDKQFIKFQQLPQYVPQGETPHAINVIAYDYNVDGVKPGDRVEVVGIYRVQQQRVMKSRAQTRSVYKTHLDLISWRISDQDRLKMSPASRQGDGKSLQGKKNLIMFSDIQKQYFLSMASDPNIVDILVDSFAPSIHGNSTIKKGILAQLFGGTKKQLPQLGRGRFRSDINICLVGDPSTAKSQLLKQVHNIAPRGIYTSGRGSSAVGLTAHVKRDPQTKQFILESGALVLSDLGICCIDQFDKMDDNNKIILLEGMEQQTISIAKAGIVCQLNCRTSIISAANPVQSKYNPKKSVIQNINLPPALLSRFDLIYIMLDQPKQAMDKQIAFHILNMYSSHDAQTQRNMMKDKKLIPKDLLTKYITYARQYVNPQLTEQACDRLVQGYTTMRKIGSTHKTISATPRQLQSMIRISQAFAKMKLSNYVEVSDVQQAIQLINLAIQQAATDPNTGLIDMDVIVTGKTSASRQKVHNIIQKLRQIIQANVAKYKKKTSFSLIFDELEKFFKLSFKKGTGDNPFVESISEKDVLEALRHLQSEGIIALFGADKNNKPSFKLAKDYN